MSKNIENGTKTYKTVRAAVREAMSSKTRAVIFNGDSLNLVRALPDNSVNLTVTSPPYCMGREYEKSNSIRDFIEAHKIMLPEIVRITKPGGSICWQIGHHISQQVAYPLDYAVFALMQEIPGVSLRNRIVWTFSHGLHNSTRFSGRHETVLWFTKGANYHFDLDAVRVPQKYPGKRHYKGPLKGEFSGNPKGKNPGDVWSIPNVKGNHIEKSDHPCQFPVALVQRLARALCPDGGLIFDPYMGSGSAGVAALLENKKFLGAEIQTEYVEIAKNRLTETIEGNARFRPLDRPIYEPTPDTTLTKLPEHFVIN
tara:strand:+ start:2066 stop:3001 length:936 start_codon:yes stop_codon:yes gene_type:complete